MMPPDLVLGAPITPDRYQMSESDYSAALKEVPKIQRQAIVQEVNTALAALQVPPGMAKGLLGFFAANKITDPANATANVPLWQEFANRKYGADFPAMQKQAREFLDASGAKLWKDLPPHLLENAWLVTTLLTIRDNGAKWKALNKKNGR